MRFSWSRSKRTQNLLGRPGVTFMGFWVFPFLWSCLFVFDFILIQMLARMCLGTGFLPGTD